MEFFADYLPHIAIMALVAITMDILKEFVAFPKQTYPIPIIIFAVFYAWLMGIIGWETITLQEAFALALMSSGAYGWGKAMLGKS